MDADVEVIGKPQVRDRLSVRVVAGRDALLAYRGVGGRSISQST
jgi:hypothetical protein